MTRQSISKFPLWSAGDRPLAIGWIVACVALCIAFNMLAIARCVVPDHGNASVAGMFPSDRPKGNAQ